MQPQVLSSNVGGYSISGLPGCQPYTVTPFRNDDPLNGVSTYDLVLISKHILGITPLGSPYKLIAADANANGSVTTFDIVELRKLILGIDTVFAHNTSWRFVPAGFVFPNPAVPSQTVFPENLVAQVQISPVAGLDFIGIKTGDVNGSVIPFGNEPVQDRRVGEWPLVCREQSFRAGDRVEVTFSTDCSNLAGMQFSLQFDVRQLALTGISPAMTGLHADNFGTWRSREGLVTVCFENDLRQPATGLCDIFRIVFQARAEGWLSDVLQLTDQPTSAQVYEPDGMAHKPVLNIVPLPGAVARIWPDPFGATGVWLQFPALGDEDFDLQIFDQQGNIVFRKSIESAAAANGFYIPASDFPGPGVFFYRFGRKGLPGITGKIMHIN
jgi:hypothetical protein